jgi:hypothetical protein
MGISGWVDTRRSATVWTAGWPDPILGEWGRASPGRLDDTPNSIYFCIASGVGPTRGPNGSGMPVSTRPQRTTQRMMMSPTDQTQGDFPTSLPPTQFIDLWRTSPPLSLSLSSLTSGGLPPSPPLPQFIDLWRTSPPFSLSLSSLTCGGTEIQCGPMQHFILVFMFEC